MNETVGEIKEKVSAVLALPAEQFRIITSGKELLAAMNPKTVKDLGLVDKQTLNVVKRTPAHQVDSTPKAEPQQAELLFLSWAYLPAFKNHLLFYRRL